MVNIERATLPIVSGGFDPLHGGHLDMIHDAYCLRGFCKGIIVLLNSDAWLTRKKGKPFMPFFERRRILLALEAVWDVVEFDDSDDTCIDGLEQTKKLYPQFDYLFCNGGDRTANNIPEMDVEGITCLFNIGGGKTNSSSDLTSEGRLWGNYQVLYEVDGCKVKELVIAPNSGISYQQHNHRSEFWFVHEGNAFVRHSTDDPENAIIFELRKHESLTVEQGDWHQIYNPSEIECKLIEIQYGAKTDESDIVRLDYYDPNGPL